MLRNTKSTYAMMAATFMLASIAIGTAYAQSPDGQNPHHYPPMLGDTNPYKFGSGLEINAKTYNVVNHLVSVNQILPIGKQANIQLNVFDVRQTSEVKHIGIYFAPDGQTIPTSSMPYIEWDSSTGVTKNTGHDSFSGMTGQFVTIDTNHGQGRFSFFPTQPLGKTNIIVRMWDIRGVSEDHVVTGIVIGHDNPGTVFVDNPCEKIVKKKGWTLTQACLDYIYKQ